MNKCLKCIHCAHFNCDDEYYSTVDDEWYIAVYCEKDHYDHVGYGSEACEDFEEE